MLTFINLDIIMFFNYFLKNSGAKKIHNLVKRLSYNVYKFPGNKNYRQGNFFGIR